MSTAPRQVFISRVSREFGPLAEELRNLLQSVDHAGRTQLSFRQEPDADTTLAKLSQYIHQSHAVLCLTGILSGGYPSDPSLDDPIHPAPPAGSPHPTWRQLLPPGFQKLSYTQWEVILAKFWQKPRYLYFRSPDNPAPFNPTPVDDLPHQEQFLKYLTRHRSSDRDSFQDIKDLKILVLRDLWPRQAKARKAFGAAAVSLLAAAAGWQLYERKVEEDMRRQAYREGMTEAIRAFPETLRQARLESDTFTAEAVRDKALQILAEDREMSVSQLEWGMSRFSETILISPDAPGMDRAAALLHQEQYAAAEEAALAVKEAALAFASPNVGDAIKALLIASSAAAGIYKFDRALEHALAAEVLTDPRRDAAQWEDAQGAIVAALTGKGRDAEAIPRLEKVIASLTSRLDAEAHETLQWRNLLGMSFCNIGRGQESEKVHRAVLIAQQILLGPMHLETLASRNNLATALGAQGKYVDAEVEHRAVLTAHQRVHGAEHPATLQSRNNLAATLSAQGKNAEAEAEHRAVLAVRERVLGPEHPDTLQSRNNLAATLWEQWKHAEAEAEHRAVLAARERVLGPEHPDTLTSRNNLATALQAQGKNVEAEAEHRAVLAVRERVLGPEHPDTLISRGNRAAMLGDQGKTAEAEAEHRAVLAVRERVLGPEHPDTLSSHYNLSVCLEDLGDEKAGEGEQEAARGRWREGLEHARRAQAAGARVLGAEHPDVVDYGLQVADLEAKLAE